MKKNIHFIMHVMCRNRFVCWRFCRNWRPFCRRCVHYHWMWHSCTGAKCKLLTFRHRRADRLFLQKNFATNQLTIHYYLKQECSMLLSTEAWSIHIAMYDIFMFIIRTKNIKNPCWFTLLCLHLQSINILTTILVYEKNHYPVPLTYKHHCYFC